MAEVRLPVLISALAIPLLAWMLFRAGRERWVVIWLTMAFALMVPMVLVPVGGAIASAVNGYGSHQTTLVAPNSTPIPTAARAGSRGD